MSPRSVSERGKGGRGKRERRREEGMERREEGGRRRGGGGEEEGRRRGGEGDNKFGMQELLSHKATKIHDRIWATFNSSKYILPRDECDN